MNKCFEVFKCVGNGMVCEDAKVNIFDKSGKPAGFYKNNNLYFNPVKSNQKTKGSYNREL